MAKQGANEDGNEGPREGGEPPSDAETPTLENFRVLVKTERFDTVGDLPETFEPEDSVEGLIINDIDSLDSEEEKLIRQSFPSIDLDNVLILEQDRTPASGLKTWGLMIGGALLAIVGIALFFRRSNGSVNPPPPDED